LKTELFDIALYVLVRIFTPTVACEPSDLKEAAEEIVGNFDVSQAISTRQLEFAGAIPFYEIIPVKKSEPRTQVWTSSSLSVKQDILQADSVRPYLVAGIWEDTRQSWSKVLNAVTVSEVERMVPEGVLIAVIWDQLALRIVG
jgi:hypothetical protein